MSKPQHVAVVVCTTVEGAADYADAANIAEKAMKQAIGDGGTWNQEPPHLTVHTKAPFADREWPVHIHSIEPLDQAMRSGRVLTAMAIPRVYSEAEPEGDEQQ